MNADALNWALAQPVGTRWRDLAEAWSSGVTRVRHSDGREVSYASMDALGRAMVAGYTAQLTPTARRPNAVIARVGDGFR